MHLISLPLHQQPRFSLWVCKKCDRLEKPLDLTFKPGLSQNERFLEEKGERELSSENRSLLFKQNARVGTYVTVVMAGNDTCKKASYKIEKHL